MAYIIFKKNTENQTGTYFRIVENEADLNSFKLEEQYIAIQETQDNFNAIRLNQKGIVSYNNNIITYEPAYPTNYLTKESLITDVNIQKNNLKNFLDKNTTHYMFNKINAYYTVLSNPTLFDEITTFPFTKTIEQYLFEKNVEIIHPLQIP